MRTVRLALALIVLCSSTALAQAPATTAPGGAAPEPVPVPYDRFHEFIHNTIASPAFHVEAFGAALIDQAGGFPKEWDATSQPFLKRNAARFGQAFSASIIEAGAAQAVHYHVGYERCGCAGGFRRLGHAVVHTFVVRHVDGHFVLNTPFIASRYGAAAIANAWYPESYKVGDVIAQGSFSFGSAVGLNILDEFGPDLLRLVHLH
jgi:hypothetical protein